MRLALKPLTLPAVIAMAAAALLAGCGPSVERAFANCSEAAYKQNLSGSKRVLTPELAKTFEKTARGLAEQQCSIIRDECRQDVKSEMCQRLIQQYGK